jgi:competence protein ComEC
LSFAAILMLLCNPQSLFDVGFQMSCMAVMGIILLTPNIHNKVGSILLVSLSAQIATLPLTLYYFGQWSCYGIFLSLLVIPLSTIILYGMLGVYLLLPFTVFAQKLYIVVEEMVEILNKVVSFVASLPGAMINHVYISKFQVFLLYVAILSFYMAIKKFVLIKK